MGTVTVVIGVVTVAVVPAGAVTVTDVIGVLTVTVAATVTGGVGIGTAGTETVGTPTVEGSSDDAPAVVDELMAADVASPPLRPCVTAPALEPPVVLKWRLPAWSMSTPLGVRSASFARLPKRVAGAAAA